MGFRKKSNLIDYRKVQKVEFKGRHFDSKYESILYQYLLACEQQGELKNIRCQVTFDLLPRLGKRVMQYRADFVAWDVKMGCDVAIEMKGYESDVWVQKLKVYRFTGPMPLRIYKCNWGKLGLLEEVIPDRQKMLDWLSAPLALQGDLIK